MPTKEEIAQMTGAGMSARAPKMPLDQIEFLGKNSDSEKYPFRAGHFRLKKMTEELKEGEKEYPQTDLGNQPLDVVFLKIRRIMTYYKQTGSPRTNEHNAKGDVVTLFGEDGGVQIGTGYEMYEKNPKLKTNQIVYCYVPTLKTIVRLVVKGISLGGQEKVEGVTSFYDYLGNFSKEKLHAHEHFTKLVPFSTQSAAGTIWGMNFQRGTKLDEQKIAKVEEMIQEVYTFCQESDAFYAEQQAKKGYVKPEAPTATPAHAAAQKVVQDHKEEMASIEYPEADEEDANVADIPF